MGVVVRRYIDFFIRLLISTPPVCISYFLQQHPYFFVHFKMFFVLAIIVGGFLFICRLGVGITAR